jgi:hypothetical protein
MRDVYSKSEFCIAATGAESGDVGLFFDRDFEQLTPVIIEATWSKEPNWPTSPGSYLFGFYREDVDKAINSAPLNRRAWVAQERFLSPRTLHFTRSMLSWECHTALNNESDPTLQPYFHSQANYSLRKSLDDIRLPDSGAGPMHGVLLSDTSNDTRFSTLGDIYQAWCSFLTRYTSCGITKESDILVALVGVSDEVEYATGDCLDAGLWKAHFIKELCWKVSGDTSRPSSWRAPSWSWASLSGEIGPHPSVPFMVSYNMAAVIDIYISTKLSGEVEQGSVLMECRLIPAAIQRGALKHHAKVFNAYCTLDERVRTSSSESIYAGDSEEISVALDVANDFWYNADQAVDVQLLVLLKFESRSSQLLSIDGICVVDSGNQVGAFERVGFFLAEPRAAKLLLAAYDQAWVQAISLV